MMRLLLLVACCSLAAAEWREATAKTGKHAGRPYYWDTETKERRWDRPEGFSDDAGAPQGAQIADELAEPITGYAQCSTTKGEFVLALYESWAPRGVARFKELVQAEFLTDVAVFRCVKGFMCQFGIVADNDAMMKWDGSPIKDDPNVGIRVKRGYIAFAGSGPNSRAAQMFIANHHGAETKENTLGDAAWEVPFGRVLDPSMDDVVGSWFTGYGDVYAGGAMSDPNLAKFDTAILEKGREGIENTYGDLTFINSCKLVSVKQFEGSEL